MADRWCAAAVGPVRPTSAASVPVGARAVLFVGHDPVAASSPAASGGILLVTGDDTAVSMEPTPAPPADEDPLGLVPVDDLVADVVAAR